MRQKNQPSDLKVEDVYHPCDFCVHDADSMMEIAQQIPDGFSVIPVFDYAQKYTGSLLPRHFIRFQNEYFQNLRFEDRGNEFVMDKEDSDIHFVPIDRVSRYVDSTIQPVSLDDTVDYIKSILSEQAIFATPVFNRDNHFVGAVSLLDIAMARSEKKVVDYPCHRQ